MAAYPSLPTSKESEIVPVQSRELVRATNGAVKVRIMHPTEKVEIRLTHWLTQAQKSLLDAHYATDKAATFSYTWPGVGGGTYTCAYAAAPQHEEQPGGWFISSVILIEV